MFHNAQPSSVYEPGLPPIPQVTPNTHPLPTPDPCSETSLQLSAGPLKSGCLLETEPSLVPFAVSKTMTKSRLGQKGVYLAYRLQSIIKGSQGLNLAVGTAAETAEEYLFPMAHFSDLSYTA